MIRNVDEYKLLSSDDDLLLADWHTGKLLLLDMAL